MEGKLKYPSEFWSEIISSKIGQYFGFVLLDYNIALRIQSKQQIGCISKSMIDPDKQVLVEGKEYLMGHDPIYDPEKDWKKYSFRFITEALKDASLCKSLDSFIEMLIFDAIIGNSDRHQENWGFIVSENKSDIYVQPASDYSFLTKFFKKTPTILKKAPSSVFSPIYDSGCCLGREMEGKKLKELLESNHRLLAYVNRGKSEVHLNLKKQKHFEFVSILRSDYKSYVEEALSRVREKFDLEELRQIVNKINSKLPLKYHEEYGL